jgi:hypothetical protein
MCQTSRRALLATLTATPLLSAPRAWAKASAPIAGIAMPDTRVVKAAVELARTAMPGYLFNHCMRTWLFGALTARQENIRHDAEALIVASALHDLGLVAAWSTPGQPFEMDSADAAKALALKNGAGEKEAELVWRSIAFHTSALGAHEAPAVNLVGAGAGADVFGGGLKAFKPDDVAATLAAYPRLGFKAGFQQSLTDYCRRKPRAQIGTWTDAYCRAHAPEVKWPTLEAGMARSPFSE